MNWKGLEKYLPEGALPYIDQWLEKDAVLIKITRARKGKLGDYRFLKSENRHQITINHDLNPELFFFVLTHEIGHLMVRKQFGTHVLSHGVEWKLTFGQLLLESIQVYNKELQALVYRHALSPKASTQADRLLYRYFFHKEEDQGRLVSDLAIGQQFRLGKRIFERGEKRKIRYICREVGTKRNYLVSGLAVVDEIVSE